MVFQAMLQQPVRGSYVLHVRTAAEPASLAPSVAHQIHRIDGEALVTDVRTLPEVVQRQLGQDRMFATLASFFALLALLLGCIGIYGVVAYRMERRTAEIGLRIALGAQRADVLWLTMRETVMLLVGGVVIGLPVTMAATRLLKQFLFGLEPQDPTTIACATIILIAAGVLAGLLPARRAAHIDPMTALRRE
jgi:ABC-type antimicrobial peptide transport system permease subunit